MPVALTERDSSTSHDVLGRVMFNPVFQHDLLRRRPGIIDALRENINSQSPFQQGAVAVQIITGLSQTNAPWGNETQQTGVKIVENLGFQAMSSETMTRVGERYVQAISKTGRDFDPPGSVDALLNIGRVLAPYFAYIHGAPHRMLQELEAIEMQKVPVDKKQTTLSKIHDIRTCFELIHIEQNVERRLKPSGRRRFTSALYQKNPYITEKELFARIKDSQPSDQAQRTTRRDQLVYLLRTISSYQKIVEQTGLTPSQVRTARVQLIEDGLIEPTPRHKKNLYAAILRCYLAGMRLTDIVNTVGKDKSNISYYLKTMEADGVIVGRQPSSHDMRVVQEFISLGYDIREIATIMDLFPQTVEQLIAHIQSEEANSSTTDLADHSSMIVVNFKQED